MGQRRNDVKELRQQGRGVGWLLLSETRAWERDEEGRTRRRTRSESRGGADIGKAKRQKTKGRRDVRIGHQQRWKW